MVTSGVKPAGRSVGTAADVHAAKPGCETPPDRADAPIDPSGHRQETMPVPPEPTAVIFDMDGVLLDSESTWDRIREDLTRAQGGVWHDRAHRAMMGMNSAEWPRYMHQELGVGIPPEAILDHVTRALIERYTEQLPLLPGAADAVRRMARHWPLAVASSSPLAVIEAALRAAGLRDAFAEVVSSEEVARGKPAPDVYLEAARRLGVDPTACVAVEDSTSGVRSAAAAGMRVVVIPNPDYPPDPNVMGSAHVLLSAISELTPDLVSARAGGANS